MNIENLKTNTEDNSRHIIVGNPINKSYLIKLSSETTKKILRLTDNSGTMDIENIHVKAKEIADYWNSTKEEDFIILDTIEVVECCDEQKEKIAEMMSEIIDSIEQHNNFDDMSKQFLRITDGENYSHKLFTDKSQNSKKNFKRKKYFWD